MRIPELHPNEAARLAALRDYGVLDTPPEEGFDDLTALAAHICQTPIALISLVDQNRVWFKSAHGLDASEMPRDVAFCAHVMDEKAQYLVVPDTTRDDRFAGNPLVTGAPGLRFYAGALLRSDTNMPLGALCVADRIARELTPAQQEALRLVARQVMTQMELRRAMRRQDELVQQRVEAEERFRRVVENVEDVVFEADIAGRWTYLNPAWATLTGYTVEEGVGAIFSDWVHPDDINSIDTERASYVEQGNRFWRSVQRYRTRQGGYRWVESHARLIFGKDGQLKSTVGTLRDITAAHEMALELRRAREVAERSQRMMSDFVANMSHEVRTPLNGVLGLTKVLLSTNLDAEQRSYLATLQESGEILLAIVNDVLDLSKIEAGRMTLEETPFELRTVVEQSLEAPRMKARGKGLDFFVTVDPEVPAWVVGDPVRLRQLLLNLADNAVKFTTHGLVGVTVTLSPDDERGSMVRVRVRDTGLGIPAAKIGAIFDKFVQADSSTTRTYGGTGLGLAICRQLVELMGGRMDLDSTEGRGSMFWFDLPLPTTEAPDASKAVAVAPAPRGPGGARPRVLVAEDNPTNQLVIRLFLRDLDCDVVIASDGEEAVAQAMVAAYDAILMDLQMPNMDGLEATRRIRERSLNQQAPIIAMTASAMESDRQACRQAGMTGFIAKPLQAGAVAGALHEVIGMAQTSETIPNPLDARPDERVFDPETLGYFPPADALQLVDLLVTDVRRYAAQLQASVAEADWKNVARAAHVLAGAASNVMALEVCHVARACERAIRDGHTDVAAECAARLGGAVTALVEALDTWRSGQTARGA